MEPDNREQFKSKGQVPDFIFIAILVDGVGEIGLKE